MSDPEILDPRLPDPDVLSVLGLVNFAWAQLDLISSGAFAGMLKLDPVELGITVGRLETQAKIDMMLSIARHRRDEKTVAFLAHVKKQLAQLRPMRNSVTHGVYIGKSGSGELIFNLPAEFIMHDERGTGHKLFVVIREELEKHVSEVMELVHALLKEFDYEAMRKLLQLPGHVRNAAD